MRAALAIIAAASAVISCAHHGETSRAADEVKYTCQPCPTEPALADDLTFEMARGSCGNTLCPHYIVRVHSNGRVEFEGLASVAVPQFCQAKLARSQLDELEAAIAEPRLRGLRILEGNPDGSWLSFAVYDAGRVSLAAGKVDDQFGELSRRVDEILKTAQLVGDRHSRAQSPAWRARCTEPDGWGDIDHVPLRDPTH